MTDFHTDSEKKGIAPAPEFKKKAGLSLVWMIPLVTAIVGGWLIFKTVSEKGPEITITFRTAEGIEVGKTKIKHKDIEIGVVDSVYFNKDFSRVIVKARMEKEFKRKKTERSEFIPVQLTSQGLAKGYEYHGSAHIHAYTKANGLIHIPKGVQNVKSGEVIEVMLI